jgi:hypothetical protein
VAGIALNILFLVLDRITGKTPEISAPEPIAEAPGAAPVSR